MYTAQQALDALTNLDEGARQPYDGPFDTGSVDEPPVIPEADDWAHAAARGVFACLNREEAIYAVLGAFDEVHRKVLTEEVTNVIRLAFDREVRTLPKAQQLIGISRQRFENLEGELQVMAMDENDGAGWKEYWANIDSLCAAPEAAIAIVQIDTL